MSIGCLLAMPKAQGIFQRAIMESAVGEMARPLKASVKVAETFLQIAGLPADDLKALRSLSIKDLLFYPYGFGNENRRRVSSGHTCGRWDNHAQYASGSDKDGSAKNIPVIVGSNLDEWKLFAAVAPNPEVQDEEALTKRLQRSFQKSTSLY
jgi:para-nitrobenzyl esterase